MSGDPAVVQMAGLALPESIKGRIRPLYQRASRRYITATGEPFTFEHGGETHTLKATKETAWAFNGLVEGGQITREGIPIDVLDLDDRFDRALDIGAHHGIYSVLLGLLNPGLYLTAFEPEKRNRAVCREVLLKNDIDASVRRQVVTDTSGVTEFFVAPEDGSESHTLTPTDGFDRVEKPSIALSDEIDDSETAFVKIDVEGAEWQILSDLVDSDATLSGLVELHPDKLPVATDDVLALLDREFETVEFLGDTSPNHPAADRIDHPHNRPMYHFDRP